MIEGSALVRSYRPEWEVGAAELADEEGEAVWDICFLISDGGSEHTSVLVTDPWMFRMDEQWYAAWEDENAAYLLSSKDAERGTAEAAAGILMEYRP